MKKHKIRYSEIIPRTRQWPIVNLSKNRKKFIQEVTEESFHNLITHSRSRSLREELEMTVYREKLRIRANSWRVDPQDDKEYWGNVQHRLVEIQNHENAEEIEKEILKDIISRYANEISGNFKNSSYRFARAFITFGFARLLNATRVKGFASLFSRQLDLDDKIHIVGETEHIRSLARHGTVVMVPTHFSNLDSILIGWVIQFLGLPAFIYGAGLNLFNIKLIAYFMNSLGAYKVDRRKKNPVYLETLKTYSSLALRWGCHSLFFPGGTRSRSGEIEKALKLGLLGTTIEAQRIQYQQEGDKARKIFIVPVVLNYQFTLEAPSLINEHLKIKGQERYYQESDEFSTSYKIATFLLKFFTKGSDISVSIGRGMDILGNYVDMDGNSLDKNGNTIQTIDYFVTNDKITVDTQREQTYVRILSKRIVEEFHIHNRVFASHLVAFTAFKMLERKNTKLDLYSILRLPDEDLELDYEEFKIQFKKLRKKLVKMEKKGKVGLAEHMKGKAESAIKLGLDNVGMYHAQRPLVRKNDKIVIQNTNTLYYYHNRM
ncbi:MAG: 1-acyl-sn-glycerol-3-phosphate acyltransferase, partial [Cyclobacteriaceae bacterium]|nr:1-acyl-sn-glycerol-3-phosphate acyltransferase [Cyclobacteriaceae bacterium]